MDWFSLLLEGLTLATLVIAHIAFTCRLSGKPAKRRYFAGYLLFLCAVDAVSRALALGEAFAAAGELLALFAFSRLALKNSLPLSCAAAVLAVYTSQLSSGIVGSLECIAFTGITGTPLLYPLVILAVLVAFALCWGSCRLILKCLPPQEEPAPYLRLPLLTSVFFFAAEVFSTQTVYSRLSAPAPAEPGKHLGLLALQVLGLSALLCTLHAYRRACQGLRAQAALDALSQAARAQQAYLEDARAREERPGPSATTGTTTSRRSPACCAAAVRRRPPPTWNPCGPLPPLCPPPSAPAAPSLTSCWRTSWRPPGPGA